MAENDGIRIYSSSLPAIDWLHIKNLKMMNERKPLFSIIVPVYNAGKYLNECIDSILQSTYDSWELLLIDDGSTDNSGLICDMRSYEDRRIRVFHKENGGVSSARNWGIKYAQGDWLNFVDSDDFISPDMLEKIVTEITGNEEADLVFTDFNILYSDRTELFKTYSWNKNKEESFRHYLLRSWPRVAWGAVKRELVAKFNIKYPETLTAFEDFYFMCCCILNSNEIIKISEPLYNYRNTNVLSITHTITKEKKLHDEVWVYRQLFHLLKSIDKYSYYAPSIYWRILSIKQSLVLDVSKHDLFISFFPEKRKYIMSCQLISFKMKIMMWCLTHHLALITRLMIFANNKAKKILHIS